jgi:16S rRNA (cytosine967-C5)-methyltransferase
MAYLKEKKRLDFLVEQLPEDLPSFERKRCHYFLFGVVRNLLLLEEALRCKLKRKPKPALQALMLLASFELWTSEKPVAVIVHHAVEQAKKIVSKAEVSLVNAVLRRMPEVFERMKKVKRGDLEALSFYYSHPLWLVKRWEKDFGWDDLLSFLRWNQEPANVYARVMRGDQEDRPVEAVDYLKETEWPFFYQVVGSSWESVKTLMEEGKIYLQNPATRLAVELLDPKSGEMILDLCASPGGKSLQLAERVDDQTGGGSVVSVDLPGRRTRRMRGNFERYKELPLSIIEINLFELNEKVLTEAGVPQVFDAVVIDVPCSNTGVLQHRVDAKWRLSLSDIASVTELQAKMLECAAKFVKPGGRLLYSTCSIEKEENSIVVERFVENSKGLFSLGEGKIHFPWKTKHDGVGTFLLHKAD